LLIGESGVKSWNEHVFNYLDALYLAAGYEIVEDWEEAAKTYFRVVDEKDAFRKNVARGRWIFCLKRLQDQIEENRRQGRDRGKVKPEDVRRERVSQAEKWGIPAEDLRKLASGPPRPLIVEAMSDTSKVHDRGELVKPDFKFSFEVFRDAPRKVRLSVESDVGDVYTLVCFVDDCFIRFQGEEFRAESGLVRVELKVLSPNVIDFDFTVGVRLVIRSGDGTTQDYLLFRAEVDDSDSTGEAGSTDTEAASRRSPSGTKATGRTTPKVKGVKAFELAAELGVKVQVVERLAVQLGLGRIRGGNQRIPIEDAEKIREAYRNGGSK